MFRIIIVFIFLFVTLLAQAQHFEGSVTYKVFERFDDPDEIVPEDSVVLLIAESMFLKQIYMDGKVWRWSLLRNDTLFESKSNDQVVYQLLEKASKDYEWTSLEGNQVQTNQKGTILEDYLGNTYFALFDSTIVIDFCIYPISANNLSYLPSYIHLNNEYASYTHEIKSKKVQKLEKSLFQIASHYQVLSQKAYDEERLKRFKSEPFMDNIIHEVED